MPAAEDRVDGEDAELLDFEGNRSDDGDED